jgi:two-component system, LytTR family, response regulator LytT
MNVIIIEDEQPAARRLERLLLEEKRDIHLLQIIDSVEDAVTFFESGKQPDLVFMDIQLGDGLSFDIFERTRVKAPVIFTTAYDHYAVKAFKVNSIDYLLKPIEPLELRQALEKFSTLFEQKTLHDFDYSAVLKHIGHATNKFRKRFLIKTAGRLAFVNVEDIAYFFSDDGNSFVVTHDNQRFLLESILEEIESELNPDDFFRISRKMIVALKSIGKIEPYFNNRFELKLEPVFDEEVIVSRQRSAEFRKWLDR